jgi:O-antigen/teichoic acid export membrane protein
MPGDGSGQTGNSHKLMSPRAALSVANSVIGAVLGTAALVFIAKNMDLEVLGTLCFAMATVGIVSFLSDFGVGSVHVLQIKSGEDLGKCVGAYASIRLVLLAIFSIVAFVLIELWKNDYMGGGMPPSDALIDSMFVFLVYYILLGVNQIATHTFDALGKSVNVYVPSILELVVRVSFIIYIAVSAYGLSEEAPALLASAYTAGIISSTLLAALFISKVKIAKPDKAVLMKYIRSLAPVFVVSMIIIFDLYLDKAVVGYFWGATELGIYFGVQKMAIFVGVFSLSVATLILPSVTTYFFRKDTAATWDVVNQAERYVSLVVIPTAAFYLVYGSDILRVFLTEDFVSSVRTMDVLVIASAIVALVLPLRSSIAGLGKSATLFWIGMGGLVLQLGLMLVLVPDEIAGFDALGLKGMGAALSLLLGSIYYFFILRYMAWKTSRILPVSHSFKHILSAAAMIGVMYLVNWLFIPAIDWIALIVLAVVGIFSYGAAAYLIGELDASDYRYFRSMLNPQGTLEYVVHEILGKRGH